MAAQPLPQPDVLYLRSREDLLSYEDARFNSLLSGMPNCYAPLNDSKVWGAFLRALAQELARIEYMYAYDLVGLSPQFLTPPDIKRRWAAPLFINKSFPNASQSDQSFKAMLTALIPAYGMGTTVEAIEAVLTAYTGQTIDVEELYRETGNGTVEDWQRNTLSLSIPAVGSNPLSAITAAAWMQVISQDLYSALDLAKPAHVGLNYSIVFAESDDLSTIIMAITDVFAPVLHDVEPSPLAPVFTQAPMLDPTSPNTALTAYGKLAGLYFQSVITNSQYEGLMSDAFRAEYVANPDGQSYSLNPACYTDVVLEDASGNVTGALSKATGTLAPQLITSWEIKSDTLIIYELD